jgi:hypothetical protein
MSTNSHVGIVGGVLVVVNDYFLTNLRNHITVEELNVSRGRRFVDVDGSTVDLVDPIGGYLVGCDVFELVIDVGSICVVLQLDVERFGVVDGVGLGRGEA